MALNQMYAVSGKRLNPNYAAMIQAQTPYLTSMKSQQQATALDEEANKLSQDRLALQKQEMLTNEELAREAMDRQKKQTRQANMIALGNLGLRGGLGMYQTSEPFRNVVDKAVGGVGGLFSGGGAEPSGAASYLGDAFGGSSGWENLGDWSMGGAGDVVSGASDLLSGAASSGIGDVTADAGSWMSDTLSEIFGGFNI